MRPALSDPAPRRCWECRVPLGPESRVVVRTRPRSVDAERFMGRFGTVRRIHVEPESGLELLFVEFDDGALLRGRPQTRETRNDCAARGMTATKLVSARR
jgi:hypothetical protein